MKSHELTRSASLFPARGLVLWLRVPSQHGGHLTGAEETGDSLESLADIGIFLPMLGEFPFDYF